MKMTKAQWIALQHAIAEILMQIEPLFQEEYDYRLTLLARTDRLPDGDVLVTSEHGTNYAKIGSAIERLLTYSPDDDLTAPVPKAY